MQNMRGIYRGIKKDFRKKTAHIGETQVLFGVTSAFITSGNIFICRTTYCCNSRGETMANSLKKGKELGLVSFPILVGLSTVFPMFGFVAMVCSTVSSYAALQ